MWLGTAVKVSVCGGMWQQGWRAGKSKYRDHKELKFAMAKLNLLLGSRSSKWSV